MPSQVYRPSTDQHVAVTEADADRFFLTQCLTGDSVDGYAMLINKNKFSDNIYFDENFFLYLENDDLCLRKKKENKKIYVAKKAKIHHLGGKSHSSVYEKEIEFSRNWHWMWSKFYFNKKYYGYTKSLFINFPTLITSLVKIIFYFIIQKKFKKKIYNKNFQFVAVSNWLKFRAEKSEVLKGYDIKKIDNNIDLDDFKLIPKSIARATLNITTTKQIILYGAQNPQSKRKGWDIFCLLYTSPSPRDRG